MEGAGSEGKGEWPGGRASAGKVMIDVGMRWEEGGNEEEETGRRGCGNKGTKLNTARSDWMEGGAGGEKGERGRDGGRQGGGNKRRE